MFTRKITQKITYEDKIALTIEKKMDIDNQFYETNINYPARKETNQSLFKVIKENVAITSHY